MKTDRLLFLLGLCGACFYAENVSAGAEAIPYASAPSESGASVMTTQEAIQMLKRYNIIDQFATGEIVSTAASEYGKTYRQNPIKAISNDLLYHFMMYQDGVEEISDYPYIDTIIELYRRANTEQEELQAQGISRIVEHERTILQDEVATLVGEPQNEKQVKTLRRLPVRCLEAFAAEGCIVKEWHACFDNILKVKPEDSKIMTFLCTKGIANSPHLINSKDKDGWTPLMYAAQFSTAEACKALIAAGAEVKVKSNYGWTPLMCAAGNPSVETLKIFLDGADVNAKNNGGNTPLMLAAINSTAEGCKVLIEAGAEVNVKKNNGVTPLITAAYRSTAETCKVLIEAGGDVNATFTHNGNRVTVLEAAAVAGNDDIVELLLQKGVRAHIRDSFYSVIRAACISPFTKDQLIKGNPAGKHNYEEVLRLLEEKSN